MEKDNLLKLLQLQILNMVLNWNQKLRDLHLGDLLLHGCKIKILWEQFSIIKEKNSNLT